MSRIGIKYQILLIILVPAFLIEVAFTYTNINNSIEQANKLLQSKGYIIAQQIAGASEFNLFSGNHEQIQYMLSQSVDTHSIVLASVHDSNDAIIAQSISKDYNTSDSAEYFYYRQPILSQSIDNSDVFNPERFGMQRDHIIGWVHLNISRVELDRTKAEIVNNSALLFAIVLLITVILTMIISYGITKPIFNLIDHLKLVEQGHLGEIIHPVLHNEIGDIQKGFNRMTRALVANRSHLNDKIQVATKQLSGAISDLEVKNKELGFARDEAQNSNRIKSHFLANISHEIRTPFNGIKGFINLLSRSPLTPTQKNYTDIILKSTNDLTAIINEILDFAKMESGKLTILEDYFDLFDTIVQTRDMLFINILEKNIDLNLIIYSDTPRFVVGDKLRLKQILINLIGNAIKFTDSGAVTIIVSADEVSVGETNIKIVVKDTGIGISEIDQQKLFTAFGQLESASNRGFGGTGLGLVISKNLVTLMNGDISMQSKVGEGTQFTVNLPFSIPLPDSTEVSEVVAPVTTVLIFSSRKYCLQEIQCIYDNAGTETIPNLIEPLHKVDQIKGLIQQGLNEVDLIVFDLRHLTLDITAYLKTLSADSKRIITMHYDRSMADNDITELFEFIPIINNQESINKLLKIGGDVVSESESDTGVLTENPKHVLLVDDNLINLELAGELIRLWGHQVSAASHAHEAISIYKNDNFDLILLDIQMPDIDGISLMNMLREIKPDDSAPIAALTAIIEKTESERLLNLGFDYYLSKPIDEKKFRSVLDGNLKLRHTIPEQPLVEPAAVSEESINYENSLLLCANNKSLLHEILEMLVRDIPNQKEQLAQGLVKSDNRGLLLALHKIHGVTCYASLPRLQKMVISAQRKLKNQQPVEASDVVQYLIQDIIEELAKVEKDTSALLDTISSTKEKEESLDLVGGQPDMNQDSSTTIATT